MESGLLYIIMKPIKPQRIDHLLLCHGVAVIGDHV